MKKLFLALILGLTIPILSACGVSQENYDTVVSERDNAVAEKETIAQKYDTLQADYEALKKENEEYKAVIEPYKDLSEAEILAKTNEANLKSKEDEKALKELEKKEADEKAAKEKEEAAAKEKEEKAGYNTGITYEQLARTPDDYQEKKVKFSGRVVQVLEADSSVQIRLAIDSDNDKIIYIEYEKNLLKSRVLEDDVITIYGVSKGLLSYQSTMGGTITIPSVLVDKVDQ